MKNQVAEVKSPSEIDFSDYLKKDVSFELHEGTIFMEIGGEIVELDEAEIVRLLNVFESLKSVYEDYKQESRTSFWNESNEQSPEDYAKNIGHRGNGYD